MKSYQEEIKNLRTEKKLTQVQFSKITGVPLRTLQDWEEGKHQPKEYIVNMLKIIIEMSVDKLCNYGKVDLTMYKDYTYYDDEEDD